MSANTQKPKAKTPKKAPPKTKAKPAPEPELKAINPEQPAYEQLDPKHQRFVDEYVIDFNATKAWLRVPGVTCTEESARRIASKLLTNIDLQRAIKERNDACGARLEAEITKDEIVRDWVRVLRADVNELVELRRVCCRYCYGRDHRYQFTPAEYEKKQQEEREKIRRKKKAGDGEGLGDPLEFELDPQGGLDYDIRKPPSEECPECHGQGVENPFFKDSRGLSPEAKALYNGVKVTQHGMEVLMRSKDKASELIARHLGMLNDKMLHSIPKDDPLAELVKQIAGSSFKPVAKEKEGQDDDE